MRNTHETKLNDVDLRGTSMRNTFMFEPQLQTHTHTHETKTWMRGLECQTHTKQNLNDVHCLLERVFIWEGLHMKQNLNDVYLRGTLMTTKILKSRSVGWSYFEP